ncbi:MAG: TetR/AcrR family transcriptional regulator, partial [Chloroflexi bacterium]|nr:TetR/AcrR family transcriptional regulator [Chloroflexota bacterium]
MAARKTKSAALANPIGETARSGAVETKGDRTRAALIEAAYTLFNGKGYHATSMRNIADAAGLALGGIYNHFQSKEDIFVAMLMERHQFLQILPELQIAEGDTVEELVRDAARRMIAKLDQQPQFLNLIFIEVVEFKSKHVPQLFQMFFPRMLEFAQRFQQVRGPLRDVPLPVILRSFVGLFFSFVITDMLIGRQLPMGAAPEAF